MHYVTQTKQGFIKLDLRNSYGFPFLARMSRLLDKSKYFLIVIHVLAFRRTRWLAKGTRQVSTRGMITVKSLIQEAPNPKI